MSDDRRPAVADNINIIGKHILDDAEVSGNAQVYTNAWVDGDSLVISTPTGTVTR